MQLILICDRYIIIIITTAPNNVQIYVKTFPSKKMFKLYILYVQSAVVHRVYTVN